MQGVREIDDADEIDQVVGPDQTVNDLRKVRSVDVRECMVDDVVGNLEDGGKDGTYDGKDDIIHRGAKSRGLE